MDMTPASATPTADMPWPPPQVVTEVWTKGIDTDDGGFTALIVGIVSSSLLLLICIIAVLLWCLSRHKGSYVTNEVDEEELDDDNESVGSDTALQSKEPLKAEEDE